MENHNYEHIAARKQRPRAFKACFLPQMLLKNKFWTLDAKTIQKQPYVSSFKNQKKYFIYPTWVDGNAQKNHR